MRHSSVYAFALCLVSITGVTTASTIYDSGNPLFVGTNITQTRAADDFTLASSANVTDVRFYGSVFSSTFPANFSGSITYAFYNNSSGALGSVISSGTVNSLSGVLWGTCGAGACYTVDFALNSSVPLVAGTYWLELHEGAALNTSDGVAVTWAGLNNGVGQPAGSSLFSASLATAPNTASVSDRSFLLFDNTAAVPEPSSAVLALIAAGAAALYRRRLRSTTL